MVGAAGRFCGEDYLFGDYGRVGFGDFPFFELAGDDGADLVAEAEGDLRYYAGRDSGVEGVVFGGGEDCG